MVGDGKKSEIFGGPAEGGGFEGGVSKGASLRGGEALFEAPCEAPPLSQAPLLSKGKLPLLRGGRGGRGSDPCPHCHTVLVVVVSELC